MPLWLSILLHFVSLCALSLQTYHMIEKCDTDIASWSESGDNFVVKNVEKFATVSFSNSRFVWTSQTGSHCLTCSNSLRSCSTFYHSISSIPISPALPVSWTSTAFASCEPTLFLRMMLIRERLVLFVSITKNFNETSLSFSTKSSEQRNQTNTQKTMSTASSQKSHAFETHKFKWRMISIVAWQSCHMNAIDG